MSEHGQHEPAAQAGGTRTGEFLAQVVRDLGETVRDEVAQLRAEAGERAAGGARGAGLLAAAGASGAVGAVALGSLPIIALRRVLPGWVIALGVAAGAGALSAVLARRGVQQLGAAAPGDGGAIKNAARQAARAVI